MVAGGNNKGELLNHWFIIKRLSACVISVKYLNESLPGPNVAIFVD